MELSTEELFKCLLSKISETEYLIKECNSLSDISGKGKLQRKIEAELRFLKRLAKNPEKLKEEHIRSSNIYHLSAIVRCCLEMQGVIKVLETFSYDLGDEDSIYERSIVVDIVADYGKTWVKVATRNPLHLYQASIGLGKYGRKSIVDQVQDMVECAEQNLHMFSIPKIIVRLAAGVTKELKSLLDELNVQVIGDIVSSDADFEKQCLSTDLFLKETSSESLPVDIEYELSQGCNEQVISDPNESNYFSMQSLPADAVLNLDVSTFLAYVSNMTNGHCHAKYNEKLLTDLAKMEQVRPVKIILDQLFKNRKLVCCETAHRDFLEILSTVGGTNEKNRASEMLKFVTVVQDDPSEQALSLDKTSKIKDRSKIVFGTGDMMKAVTVSANLGFLRAARSQGVKFVAFVRRENDGPRCTNCGATTHRSWQCPDKPNVTNNVICTNCGSAGHIAKDCREQKAAAGALGAPDKAKIDEEYMSLMAELGEGPPPPNKMTTIGSTTQPSMTALQAPPGPPRAIMAPPPPSVSTSQFQATSTQSMMFNNTQMKTTTVLRPNAPVTTIMQTSMFVPPPVMSQMPPPPATSAMAMPQMGMPPWTQPPFQVAASMPQTVLTTQGGPVVGMLAPPPPPPSLPGTSQPQVSLPTTTWMTPPAVTQAIPWPMPPQMMGPGPMPVPPPPGIAPIPPPPPAVPGTMYPWAGFMGVPPPPPLQTSLQTLAAPPPPPPPTSSIAATASTSVTTQNVTLSTLALPSLLSAPPPPPPS